MNAPAPNPLIPGFTAQQFHRDRIAEQIAAEAERRAAAQPRPATRTRKRSAPRKAADNG